MPAVSTKPKDPEHEITPLGAWKPDVSTPYNDGMPFALNLVPRSDGYYGPENGPEIFSAQDTAVFGNSLKVHGSLHSIASTPGATPRNYVGTFATAAGDSRLLSRLEQGAWSDLSRSGGYTVDAFSPWRFANFGKKVTACTLAQPTQISDGDTGQFRDIAGAPQATDVATVAGFLALININDTTYGEGSQPFRVWWSGAGDAEVFPNPISDEAVTRGSAFRDLFDGGRLRRIIAGIGNTDAIVISERKMWRMRFVGPPTIFEFNQIEADQGTSIDGSIAAFNDTFFFYGHNGFYFFDGSNSQPIGQGLIDDFWLNDISFSAAFGFQNAVQAAIDSERKCYVVSYRSQAATTDANDRILRYNWITGNWSNSEIAADSVGHVDSQASETDSPRMIMIDQNNDLIRLTGATLEATFESRENLLANAAYTHVKGVHPMIDTPDVLATVRVRDMQHRALIDSTEAVLQNDGFFRFHPPVISGRYYRTRFRIPAGAFWTSATGMIYEYAEFGHGPRVA